jgi:hypothetical protein
LLSRKVVIDISVAVNFYNVFFYKNILIYYKWLKKLKNKFNF